MAVKYYAQIDFDLFSDPRFRALSSNDVRFIYLTAQCSKLSNYIGLFRYPVEVWSYGANVRPLGRNRLGNISMHTVHIGPFLEGIDRSSI